MTLHNVLIAAAMCGALFSGAAMAQDDSDDQQQQQHHRPPGPQPGDTMDFCGKVVNLVQDGCIGVVTLYATYDLTQISPRPPLGALIKGTGTLGSDASNCQQGMHFTKATWTPTDLCTATP